ncbi:hypothetical protein FIBSPDRAFT_884923 [Athelia psychrophila]|uniref:Uncharacterized protein n=1 Tax=Athelia psychrophila TaxID=1759441 RepID=A0A166SJ80_9AGAM|nr:hypothetical protein FIBSPDRAFT_884923 [Fibularhizoctonia sp. CBS 109695]
MPPNRPHESDSSESDARRPSLHDLLKLSQKTTGEQAAQIQSLRRELALAHDQLAFYEKSSASAASKKSLPPLLFDGGDQVKSLGKKYAMLEALWLDVIIFDLPRNFKDHPDSRARFVNNSSYNEGSLAALCNLIPAHLHEHMLDKGFRSTFVFGTNSQRSSVLNTISSVAHDIIGVGDSATYSRDYNRAEDERFTRLLSFSTDKNAKKTPALTMPWMYQDCANKLSGLLKTPILVKMLLVAFYGRGSINGRKSGCKATQGVKWQLKKVTPGMLAAVCTFGKYILSQDTQLDRVGATTSFNYADDQRELKKLIVFSMESSTAVRANIAYLNASVFGEMEDDPDDNKESEYSGDEVQNLLQRLALDEGDDDEAPPTVDTPSLPRDLRATAPLSRASTPPSPLSPVPSFDLPETANVATSSSARPGAAETVDVPLILATPPAPKAPSKKGNKAATVAVSEGTPPDTAPAPKAASKKGKKTATVAVSEGTPPDIAPAPKAAFKKGKKTATVAVSEGTPPDTAPIPRARRVRTQT